MKKLFLIAAMLLISAVAVHAQSGYFISESNGTTLDTVTNTGVKLQKLPISGYQDIVSIQVKLTNISGTTGGVVRLYGSTDGTNFVRIPTVTDAGATAIDSLSANTNAISKVFRLPTHAYTYYRIGYTGASTMAVKLQTFAIWRKR